MSTHVLKIQQTTFTHDSSRQSSYIFIYSKYVDFPLGIVVYITNTDCATQPMNFFLSEQCSDFAQCNENSMLSKDEINWCAIWAANYRRWTQLDRFCLLQEFQLKPNSVDMRTHYIFVKAVKFIKKCFFLLNVLFSEQSLS